MQLTVNDFFNLSEQQYYQLTKIIFCDPLIGAYADLSLLSDDDFTKLCHLLTNCQQLTFLDLSDNNLGNLSFANIDKLATTIAISLNLKFLDLTNNNLHILDFTAWNVLTLGLAKCSTLETIILSGNQLGTLENHILATIFANLLSKNLVKLYLVKNEIGTNNSLKILNDQLLHTSNKLKSLNLSCNQLFKDAEQVIKLFLNLQQITELQLADNQLSIMKIKYFSDPAPVINHNLQILDLSSNELGTSSTIFNFFMQQAINIKDLNLSDNQLELVGSQLQFSSCNYLEVLKLADNDFSLSDQQNFAGLTAFLAQSNHLKYLDLANTNLRDLLTNNLNDLLDILCNNSNLTAVNFARNNLGLSAGLYKLSVLLKQNKLTTLDLSDNMLGYTDIENWQYLIAGLTANYNLQKLDISANELELLSLNRIVSLSQALTSCYNLQKLNLGEQNFHASATAKLQVLFTALGQLPQLIKLDLSYSLTDYLHLETNIAVLSKFMQTTTSLRTLKLESSIPITIEHKIKQILDNKPEPGIKLKLT